MTTPTRATTLRRLNALLESTQTIPPKHFQMESWGTARVDKLIRGKQPLAKPTCGTTGCAFGWFAQRTRGLGLEQTDMFMENGILSTRFQVVRMAKGKRVGFTENGQLAAEYFGLPQYVMGWIFYPSEYRTGEIAKHTVVSRIKQTIAAFVAGDASIPHDKHHASRRSISLKEYRKKIKEYRKKIKPEEIDE